MKAFVVGGLIACLVSIPVLAHCSQPPPPPKLPDGTSASREEMVSAMQAMKAYGTAVKEFQECARKASDPLEMAVADRTADSLTALADKFNSELYAFKKKSGA